MVLVFPFIRGMPKKAHFTLKQIKILKMYFKYSNRYRKTRKLVRMPIRVGTCLFYEADMKNQTEDALSRLKPTGTGNATLEDEKLNSRYQGCKPNRYLKANHQPVRRIQRQKGTNQDRLYFISEECNKQTPIKQKAIHFSDFCRVYLRFVAGNTFANG